MDDLNIENDPVRGTIAGLWQEVGWQFPVGDRRPLHTIADECWEDQRDNRAATRSWNIVTSLAREAIDVAFKGNMGEARALMRRANDEINQFHIWHDDLKKNHDLFFEVAREMCHGWRDNGLTWMEVVEAPDNGDSTKWLEPDELMEACKMSAHYDAARGERKEQIESAVRSMLNLAFNEVYKSILAEYSESYDLVVKNRHDWGEWASFRKVDLVWENCSDDMSRCRIEINPLNVSFFEAAVDDDDNVISCDRRS